MERDNDNIKFVIYTENFNSHAHVERDLLETFMKMYVDDISTHTLTWSVTDAFYKAIDEGRFQLTRSRGA